MKQNLTINITTDPDGFYGGQEAPENGELALAAYQAELEQEIRKTYPNARINFAFEPTLFPLAVFSDDGREYDIEDVVANIDMQVYNAGRFWDA